MGYLNDTTHHHTKAPGQVRDYEAHAALQHARFPDWLSYALV